jgi:putative YphP/YqiW family bacilliredoxin
MPYPVRIMYDPELVRPMREELTRLGAQELLTPTAVDTWIADKRTGLLVINSVCGCAAGMARPGVGIAMQSKQKPERLATVFAGQDKEATARARGHFPQITPSSPSMALFKNGVLVDFLPRMRIEGRSAQDVGRDLCAMFDKHFAAQ